MPVNSTPKNLISKSKFMLENLHLFVMFPYCPELWSNFQMRSFLETTKQMIAKKLNKNCTPQLVDYLVLRVDQVLQNRRSETSRRSILIDLSSQRETLIYLSYTCTPMVVVSGEKKISNLLFTQAAAVNFLLIEMPENKIRLASCTDTNSQTLMEETIDPAEYEEKYLFLKMSDLIWRINKRFDHLIFFCGSTKQRELFMKHLNFPLLLVVSPGYRDAPSAGNIFGTIENIRQSFSNWRNILVTYQFVLAEKSGRIIHTIEPVINAISNKKNGTLFIEKQIKKKLVSNHSPDFASFKIKKLLVLLEQFLALGNTIKVTNNGLLNEFGGIALITDLYMPSDHLLQKFPSKNNDILF